MSAQLPTLALPIGTMGEDAKRPKSEQTPEQTPIPWDGLPPELQRMIVDQLDLAHGPLARTSKANYHVFTDRKCGFDVSTKEAKQWCADNQIVMRLIPGFTRPWRGPKTPWLLTLWNSDLEQWKRQCACQLKTNPNNFTIRTHHSTVSALCEWLKSEHGRCILSTCVRSNGTDTSDVLPIHIFVCLERAEVAEVWTALWDLRNARSDLRNVLTSV